LCELSLPKSQFRVLNLDCVDQLGLAKFQ